MKAVAILLLLVGFALIGWGVFPYVKNNSFLFPSPTPTPTPSNTGCVRAKQDIRLRYTPVFRKKEIIDWRQISYSTPIPVGHYGMIVDLSKPTETTGTRREFYKVVWATEADPFLAGNPRLSKHQHWVLTDWVDWVDCRTIPGSVPSPTPTDTSAPTETPTPEVTPSLLPLLTPAPIIPNVVHAPAPASIGLEGQFRVEATDSRGTVMKNEHDKPITLECVASGQWAFWPEQGFHSADGNPRYAVASQWGPNYKLPEAPLGSLIVHRGDGTYELVGAKKTIMLKPYEQVFFVMNDSDNYGKDYTDNEGVITVKWTCRDCR